MSSLDSGEVVPANVELKTPAFGCPPDNNNNNNNTGLLIWGDNLPIGIHYYRCY